MNSEDSDAVPPADAAGADDAAAAAAADPGPGPGSLEFFLRRSFLHIAALWVVVSLLLDSRLLAIVVVAAVVLLVHSLRFRPADPALTDAVLMRRGSAKALGGAPVVFGHRGAGLDMPENTLAAFRRCRDNGGDGVEIDVELTVDGVAVVLHDDTVDRTTDGAGAINNLTFLETRALNASAGHPKGAEAGFQSIPTLEETLRLCLQLGLRVFIEVKSAAFSGLGNSRLAAAAVDDLFRRCPDLYLTAMVCSFDPRALYLVRRRNPDVVTAMIWRPWLNSFALDGSPRSANAATTALVAAYDLFHGFVLHGFLWHFLAFDIISTNKNSLSFNDVAWWRARGVAPVTWTVNTFEEKRFFARYDVPVMTDSMVEDVAEQS